MKLLYQNKRNYKDHILNEYLLEINVLRDYQQN